MLPEKVTTNQSPSTSVLQVVLQGIPIQTLERQHGKKNLKQRIFQSTFQKFETFTSKESFADFIDMFVDMYPAERVEDIFLFAKHCISGKFGKTYGKLSAADIGLWFQQYLDWKYEQIEIQRNQEKSKHHSNESIFNIKDPKTGLTLGQTLQREIKEDKVKNDEESVKLTHETYLEFLILYNEDMTDDDLFSIYKQSYMIKNKEVMFLLINIANERVKINNFTLQTSINEFNEAYNFQTENLQDM